MITRISGVLNRVLDEEVRLQAGPMEYQVMVPEFVRRNLQNRLGQDVSLFTIHFFEGNPMQGRVVPRLIGFLSEMELDFFDLFCTVDKVGTRKAMKAMVRPMREIAAAIHREDSKWLTSLPGVGAATADQIITSLKRKVTRFAHAAPQAGEDPAAVSADRPAAVVVDGNVVDDAYQALMALGLSPIDARNRLDKVLTGGQTYKSAQDIIEAIFKTP